MICLSHHQEKREMNLYFFCFQWNENSVYILFPLLSGDHLKSQEKEKRSLRREDLKEQ